MKNIELVIPKLNQYSYEQKFESDPKTMSYNAVYVNYQYNKNDDIYECGVLIESKYRGKGYSKDALRLLIKEDNKNGIEYLYDTFEKDRENTLKAFLVLNLKYIKKLLEKNLII